MDVSKLSDQPLRGDYHEVGEDYVKRQDWSAYSQRDHALWRMLYRRQLSHLRYFAEPFLTALDRLDIGQGIPRLEQVSFRLERATGWRLVAVPGLIPNEAFFRHLSQGQFPVTDWIRRPDEADYLVEPDIFHDFFGHVPLLFDPVYADYMAAYGAWGASASPEQVEALTRLYWYVVEFGLMHEAGGLKAFGAGIVSSPSETVFSVESPSPHRLAFDVDRVLRTGYRIDDFQRTYFVLESFDQLMDATREGLFDRLTAASQAPTISPTTVLAGDEVIRRGDQSRAGGRSANG